MVLRLSSFTVPRLRWSNNLHAKKIINNESVYKIGQQFDFKETQSALGNAKYQDKRLVEHKHHGRAGSYEAILVSSIDEEITIILLTNNYNGKVHELSDKIFNILRDKKYAQPNKKIQK